MKLSELIPQITDLFTFSLILTLYLLLPSIQLEKYWDFTQSSKLLTFGYVVTLLFFLYLIDTLFKKKRPFRLCYLDLGIVAVFILLTISKFLVPLQFSHLSNYYELCGLILLYFILRNTNYNYFKYFLVAVIGGGVLQSLVGLLQLYGLMQSNHPLFRLTGSFFNPGPYGIYLGIVLCLILGCFLFLRKSNSQIIWVWDGVSGRVNSLKKTWLQAIFFISLILVLLVFPATLSRTAWLAVFVAIGWILVRNFGAKSQAKLLYTLGLLACIVLIVSLSPLWSSKKNSSLGRILIWKISMQMLNKSPWMGIGFDEFKNQYSKAQAEYFREFKDEKEVTLSDGVTSAYNEVLQFTVENGIIGLAVLMAVIGTLLFSKYEENGIILEIAQAGLIYIFISALFSYPFQILVIKVILVLFLALAAHHMESIEVYIVKLVKRLFFVRTSLIVGCFFLCFYSLAYLNHLSNGYLNWKFAFNLYSKGNFSESFIFFKKALPTFYNSGEFLTCYGKALSVGGRNEEAIKVLRKAEIYQNNSVVQISLGNCYKEINNKIRAEECYLLASLMVPSKLYPKYLLARLYSESDRFAEAKTIAIEILNYNEKVKSDALQEMRYEMKQLILKKR